MFGRETNSHKLEIRLSNVMRSTTITVKLNESAIAPLSTVRRTDFRFFAFLSASSVRHTVRYNQDCGNLWYERVWNSTQVEIDNRNRVVMSNQSEIERMALVESCRFGRGSDWPNNQQFTRAPDHKVCKTWQGARRYCTDTSVYSWIRPAPHRRIQVDGRAGAGTPEQQSRTIFFF